MKKIFIIFLVVIIIIISLIFLFKKEPLNMENWQPAGFGNEYIEPAIIDYLLTQDYFSWQTKEESYRACLVDNLGQKDSLFPLSVWVYCGEYVIENGEIVETSGFSGPAEINYPNELSFYDIERFSHQAPREGSLYTKDIKDLFPKEIQQIIFSFNPKNISEKTKQKAKDYFDLINDSKNSLLISRVIPFVAEEENVNKSEIIVLSIEDKEWTNGCFCMDARGLFCTQAMVYGQEIKLNVKGDKQTYCVSGSIIRKSDF